MKVRKYFGGIRKQSEVRGKLLGVFAESILGFFAGGTRKKRCVEISFLPFVFAFVFLRQ